MTVKKIVLKDFQPHARLSIKLGRVTVLVGESYAGKSAVVRALRLLAFNKPKGNSYVRHGRKFAKVSVELVHKKRPRTVAATRGKGSNAYFLDGKKYAPERKRSVPQAVEELLNLGPVNFQFQDEPHLWLFDSPGQVAKHLNEIADLETMDRVMAEVAKEVRRLTAEVNVTRDRLRAARAEGQSLAFVPSLVRLSERMESAGRRAAVFRATFARAERSIRQAGLLRSATDRLSGASVYAKKAIRAGVQSAKAADRTARLAELIAEVGKNQPAELPDVRPIVEARAKADSFAERRRALEDLITRAEQCSAGYSDLSTRLNRSQKRLSKFSNKRCPTCGRKWPSSRRRICTSHKKPRKPGQKKATTG